MDSSTQSSKDSSKDASKGSNIPVARRRIARIRCFQECIKHYQEKKTFPEALYYVPSEIEYAASIKTTWKLYAEPSKDSKVIKEISATLSSRLIASGEDMRNAEGKWIRVIKVKVSANENFEKVPGEEAWILLISNKSSTDELPIIVPVSTDNQGKGKGSKKQKFKVNDWETYLEEIFSLRLKKHESEVVAPDAEAVERLKTLGEGWSFEHDACLIQLMSENMSKDDSSAGILKNFVQGVEVSSYSSGDGEKSSLTDNNPDTYWETDGSEGQHWIRLCMKKGTVIENLTLTVHPNDDNYLPQKMVVLGGEADGLKNLNTVEIDWDTSSQTDIKLLDKCLEHYPVIMIRIKACKSGGIDCRLRGIKLHCQEERSLGLDKDFFSGNNLIKFPVLQPYSPLILYRRSIVLQRFIWLLDSVMHYLVPSWHHSIDNAQTTDKEAVTGFKNIRHILPLSRKRLFLMETLLRSTASESSNRPVVYLNRHAAHEHRENPSASPDFSKTVFMQLFESLRPKDRSSSPMHYRWTPQTDQWWECKFISEGVIDQGGGFRDCLSDLAEELCPADTDAPIALPFFIRAPNQDQDDSTMNKDVYVPNPNCNDNLRYEWLGQLMGACFRTKDILVLPLAPFIWKKLSGQLYTWTEDYATVDATEVKLIDSLVGLDRETFNTNERSWSAVLSDGSHVSLKVDDKGNPLTLAYEDREEYANKVRQLRMAEFDKQLKAIKAGLLKVLPEAIMSLVTWQELEARICGEPEISVEALMKSTYYNSLDEDSVRVKHFWAAVRNFSNEDRSRLLRFISGRRRLPVNIFLSSGKSSPTDPLPESSTCANTLHLPLYTDEKIAEERLRYAAYCCVSIDTDA